jgi:dipeptide/tripeptide permease
LDEPIEFPRASEAAPAELFGHPKGLSFLFATEMWERFSYYGMRALLVLYMTKYLLLPGHAEHVAGLPTVRHGLESVFGPLALQPLASQIYGFYTALVYFTPILGGLLADRVLGQRRTVIVGAILMAIGHFMMFWAVYEQQGNTITLWADANTDRSVSLLGWHGQIPTTWFLSVNPFLIFAFTPLLVALWQRQSLKGREPSTIMKMALGCFGAALAYAILALAAWYAGAGKASCLWLLGYFTILTLGELYLSPIGLSLVTKLAPARMFRLSWAAGWQRASPAIFSPAGSAASGAGWAGSSSS